MKQIQVQQKIKNIVRVSFHNSNRQITFKTTPKIDSWRNKKAG